MDDLLATTLQEYPEIWDRRCSAFRNKIKKENAIKELAAILNTTTDNIEKRYKALREKYRKEKLKSCQTSRSGAGAADFEEWHLMETLLFLDSVMTTRITQSNWKMIQPPGLNNEDDDCQSQPFSLSDLQPTSPEPAKEQSEVFSNDRNTSDSLLSLVAAPEVVVNQETSTFTKKRREELLHSKLEKKRKLDRNSATENIDSVMDRLVSAAEKHAAAGQLIIDNEYSAFGKFMADSFRKVKENLRDDCVLALHKVLLEYKKQ